MLIVGLNEKFCSLKSCLLFNIIPYTGKKLANHVHSPKFYSPIFTDTENICALTVAYSPNFSSPTALTCMVHQDFPPPNISCVRY